MYVCPVRAGAATTELYPAMIGSRSLFPPLIECGCLWLCGIVLACGCLLVACYSCVACFVLVACSVVRRLTHQHI